MTTSAALDTAVPGNLGLEYHRGNQPVIANLTTGFTFLDDFQVSLLLRATQASQYSSTLTAPRLTLFNGQRAFVVVATETAYVSDLTPIVGTNAVAFDPTVGHRAVRRAARRGGDRQRPTASTSRSRSARRSRGCATSCSSPSAPDGRRRRRRRRADQPDRLPPAARPRHHLRATRPSPSPTAARC